MSQSDLRLQIGLEKAASVDLIEVCWPATRQVERFTRIDANQILTIKEGAGIIRKVKYAGPPGASKAALELQ